MFEKHLFFTKYTLFAEKNVFIWKKKFIEKNIINENVKKIYLISEIYFYTENVCVTNKISIFLKYIFILQKKNVSDDKKIYLLKLRCELSNLVCKISEAANLWHSLNYLFPKT